MMAVAAATTVVCSINPILPTSQFSFARTTTGHLQRRLLTVSVRAQQQLNVSVLRFPLGILELDESYLPRWLRVGFGLLVLLNHFLSINPTSPQIRSEILEFCLAVFSAMLPFLGRFLKMWYPIREKDNVTVSCKTWVNFLSN